MLEVRRRLLPVKETNDRNREEKMFFCSMKRLGV